MKEITLADNLAQWCENALGTLHERLLKTTPLRVEASHRSFYRIHTAAGSRVLMVSPPELEHNAQFAALARLFAAHDVPVPEILALNESEGWFLLTDLGATHLEDVYATPARDDALRAAIDLLPRIAQIEDPAIEPYTGARFDMELDIFSEWFASGLLGGTPWPGFEEVSARLVASAQAQPKGCVHRDYHCRNLLYTDGRLGVVDFQDALHGPLLYDIASLLHDCYHAFEDDEIERWLGLFVSLTPALDDEAPATIRQWFDWIAVQRQLKAVGIFARLRLRDGKSSHLTHIMSVMDRLAALCARYPELEQLGQQLADCRSKARQRIADIE